MHRFTSEIKSRLTGTVLNRALYWTERVHPWAPKQSPHASVQTPRGDPLSATSL